MIAYFDSSAVVKLLVPEPGSDVAAEIWHTAGQRICGSIAYAEICAALAAAHRLRRITKRTHTRATHELDKLWNELASIAIDDQVSRLAGALANDQALRGFDAVHLACALAAGVGVGVGEGSGECVMVTWDTDLHEAAAQCGLAVAPARL